MHAISSLTSVFDDLPCAIKMKGRTVHWFSSLVHVLNILSNGITCDMVWKWIEIRVEWDHHSPPPSTPTAHSHTPPLQEKEKEKNRVDFGMQRKDKL